MVKQRLETRRFGMCCYGTVDVSSMHDRRAKRDSDQVLTFDPASRRVSRRLLILLQPPIDRICRQSFLAGFRKRKQDPHETAGAVSFMPTAHTIDICRNLDA